MLSFTCNLLDCRKPHTSTQATFDMLMMKLQLHCWSAMIALSSLNI